jgi:hypothetical protein
MKLKQTAARARDNARQMKQRRLIELAREQGRKMGYDEGIQAGQRIGYYDGQGPDDGTKVDFNEGPRFREVFDESNYRLDNFDQPPPNPEMHHLQMVQGTSHLHHRLPIHHILTRKHNTTKSLPYLTTPQRHPPRYLTHRL